jgi:two-component system cell cycle response regulator
VARTGGEEFVVVMPDTDLDTAAAVAERLRARVGGDPIEVSALVSAITVTISIGIAVAVGADETVERLLKRADDALYQAKRAGRNRTVADGVGVIGAPGSAVPVA